MKYLESAQVVGVFFSSKIYSWCVGGQEEGAEQSGMIHFQFTNIFKYSGLDTPLQQVSLLDATWCVVNVQDKRKSSWKTLPY